MTLTLSTGRLFNEYGNLVNWWTPEVESQFKSKADCMKEQYNNYVVPEAKQNVCLSVKNTNKNLQKNFDLENIASVSCYSVKEEKLCRI